MEWATGQQGSTEGGETGRQAGRQSKMWVHGGGINDSVARTRAAIGPGPPRLARTVPPSSGSGSSPPGRRPAQGGGGGGGGSGGGGGGGGDTDADEAVRGVAGVTLPEATGPGLSASAPWGTGRGFSCGGGGGCSGGGSSDGGGGGGGGLWCAGSRGGGGGGGSCCAGWCGGGGGCGWGCNGATRRWRAKRKASRASSDDSDASAAAAWPRPPARPGAMAAPHARPTSLVDSSAAASPGRAAQWAAGCDDQGGRQCGGWPAAGLGATSPVRLSAAELAGGGDNRGGRDGGGHAARRRRSGDSGSSSQGRDEAAPRFLWDERRVSPSDSAVLHSVSNLNGTAAVMHDRRELR